MPQRPKNWEVRKAKKQCTDCKKKHLQNSRKLHVVDMDVEETRGQGMPTESPVRALLIALQHIHRKTSCFQMGCSDGRIPRAVNKHAHKNELEPLHTLQRNMCCKVWHGNNTKSPAYYFWTACPYPMAVSMNKLDLDWNSMMPNFIHSTWERLRFHYGEIYRIKVKAGYQTF